MSFTSASFWLAFFMQEVQRLPPLTVALHLLPQAIAGLLWNVVAGSILHRVNNTVIMAVGAVCYLSANLLLSLMKADSVYWAFAFPALILNVVGADFQFNVANVSQSVAPLSPSFLVVVFLPGPLLSPPPMLINSGEKKRCT